MYGIILACLAMSMALVVAHTLDYVDPCINGKNTPECTEMREDPCAYHARRGTRGSCEDGKFVFDARNLTRAARRDNFVRGVTSSTTSEFERQHIKSPLPPGYRRVTDDDGNEVVVKRM